MNYSLKTTSSADGLQIWNPADLGDVLFHYTSVDALEITSSKGEFRLSRFTRMNDPSEFAPAKFMGIDLGSDWSDENLAQWTELNKALIESRNNAHVICFSQCNAGHAIAPMWAHYARQFDPVSDTSDGYSGVCIVVNKHKLIESLETKFGADNLLHEKITYEPSSPQQMLHIDIIKGKNQVHDPNEFVREFLWFRKHECWKYEEEYRFVIKNQDDEFQYTPVNNSIVGIVAGSKCSKTSMDRIIRVANSCGIGPEHVKIADWNRGYLIPMKLFEYSDRRDSGPS